MPGRDDIYVYLFPQPVQPGECTDVDLFSFFGESGAFFSTQIKNENKNTLLSIRSASSLSRASERPESGVSSSNTQSGQ